MVDMYDAYYRGAELYVSMYFRIAEYSILHLRS